MVCCISNGFGDEGGAMLSILQMVYSNKWFLKFLNFLSGIHMNVNKSSKVKEGQAPSVHPNPGISTKRHAPLQLYDSGWWDSLFALITSSYRQPTPKSELKRAGLVHFQWLRIASVVGKSRTDVLQLEMYPDGQHVEVYHGYWLTDSPLEGLFVCVFSCLFWWFFMNYCRHNA